MVDAAPVTLRQNLRTGEDGDHEGEARCAHHQERRHAGKRTHLDSPD